MTLPVVRDSIPIMAWRWVALELDDDPNNPGHLSDEVRIGSIWRFGRLDRVSDAACDAQKELAAWGMQLKELRRREAALAGLINNLHGESRTETQLDLDRVRDDIQVLESVIEQCSPAGAIHAAPHPNCTCGFYALPSKRDLMMTYTMLAASVGNAIALVQLSGTVIEHERGYRAERQTILQITDVTCGYGVGCGRHRGPAKYLVRNKTRLLTPFCEDCMRTYPRRDSVRVYDLDAELERLGIPGPER